MLGVAPLHGRLHDGGRQAWRAANDTADRGAVDETIRPRSRRGRSVDHAGRRAVHRDRYHAGDLRIPDSTPKTPQNLVPVTRLALFGEWATQRNASFLKVIGRLREGQRIAAAQAELSTIAARLGEQYQRNKSRGVLFGHSRTSSSRITALAWSSFSLGGRRPVDCLRQRRQSAARTRIRPTA